MASYDNQFEVISPDLSVLHRFPLEVADKRLLDPTNEAVVPLIDGEFLQPNASFKWARAGADTWPAFACIETRGDYGVQASGKASVLMHGGYMADTIVFDPSVTTLGAALSTGTVSSAAVGGVNRTGLVAATSGITIGYVMRVAANNGGRLRFIQTQV